MKEPDFNPVARAYRWMEYLSFGRSLERCRFAQLDHLGQPRHALVLGDGDGRFLARLLERYPLLTADVIDASSTMMHLAQRRTKNAGSRASFNVADLRTHVIPDGISYDLVTAHFFLDCLSDFEVNDLLQRVAPRLSINAVFILSEFAVPSREPFRFIAGVLIGFLYLAFRLLTGLSVRTLPDYASALRHAGFVCESSVLLLGGILRSERWRFASGPGNEATLL